MPAESTREAALTVVTLDGPAGAGKSTTAREVARRLGYRYLDSGALYRALTHALLEEGIEKAAWPALTRERLDRLGVEVRPGPDTLVLRWRGRDLGPELRTGEVTSHVSTLALLPAVRGWLMEKQRDAGSEGRLVADGRDMGTVVFPDAATKIFLEAEPRERARRRLGDLGRSSPTEAEIDDEADRLLERDRTDRERAHAPLRVAEDAWVLDTTSMSFEEQVEAIVTRARAR